MTGAGIAAILMPPKGPKLRYAARLEFLTTNNIAEYEVMLLGLRKLRALGVIRCIIRSDSQVIVGHVEKEFTTKEPELVKYLAAVRRMEKHFSDFTFRHIPRSENAEADELAKAAAQRAPMPADVFFIKSYQSKQYEKRNGLAPCMLLRVSIGDHPYSHTSMEHTSRIASTRQIE
jgi:ribonuclease HI